MNDVAELLERAVVVPPGIAPDLVRVRVTERRVRRKRAQRTAVVGGVLTLLLVAAVGFAGGRSSRPLDVATFPSPGTSVPAPRPSAKVTVPSIPDSVPRSGPSDMPLLHDAPLIEGGAVDIWFWQGDNPANDPDDGVPRPGHWQLVVRDTEVIQVGESVPVAGGLTRTTASAVVPDLNRYGVKMTTPLAATPTVPDAAPRCRDRTVPCAGQPTFEPVPTR